MRYLWTPRRGPTCRHRMVGQSTRMFDITGRVSEASTGLDLRHSLVGWQPKFAFDVIALPTTSLNQVLRRRICFPITWYSCRARTVRTPSSRTNRGNFDQGTNVNDSACVGILRLRHDITSSCEADEQDELCLPGCDLLEENRPSFDNDG